MNKIKTLFIIGLCTLIFTNCATNTQKETSGNSETKTDSLYLKRYAGVYTIEINGNESANEIEAYELFENGQAKWMWMGNNGVGDANVRSTKSGTWTANEQKISITLQGNSGPITEDYVLQNGTFTSTFSQDRYLKPNERGK